MTEKPAYSLTEHARLEMELRQITLAMIDALMRSPGQILDTNNQRKVYQSQVKIEGKLYLIRAIVADTDPLTIVTIYRTSKIAKYWRSGL